MEFDLGMDQAPADRRRHHLDPRSHRGPRPAARSRAERVTRQAISEMPVDMGALLGVAQRSRDRNKALIEAGETFRAQKARTWDPGKGPSVIRQAPPLEPRWGRPPGRPHPVSLVRLTALPPRRAASWPRRALRRSVPFLRGRRRVPSWPCRRRASSARRRDSPGRGADHDHEDGDEESVGEQRADDLASWLEPPTAPKSGPTRGRSMRTAFTAVRCQPAP